MFRIATAIAVGMSLGLAGAAIAEPQGARARVSYADLDVGKSPGAQKLLARIETAAGQVCGPQPINRDLGAYFAYKRCHETAVANAVEAVQSPVLTALYQNGPDSAVRTASR